MAIQSTAVSGLASALGPVDDDEREDAPGGEQELEARPTRTPAPSSDRSAVAKLKRWATEPNIARHIDDDELMRLGMRVVEDYEIDIRSRADWMAKAEKAMKFANQETQAKTTPWPGASSMIFPLITQAALEFGARAIKAVIPNRSVVNGVVEGSDRGTPMMGTDGQPEMQVPPGAPPGTQPQPVWLIAPGEKTQRAQRVGEYMSWQLLRDMPEWKPQTDQLLHQIPVIGGAAKKTFYDASLRKNRSLYVSLINLVWNYRAASFESAPRHTEKVWLYPYEIEELERAELQKNGNGDYEGLFLEAEYGPGDDPSAPETSDMGGPESGGDSNDADAPHMFLEQHRRWDLDGDDYPEPYVVTVHKRSGKVVRIVARFDADGIFHTKGKIERIEPCDYYSLIRFLPNIDGGSYPVGFGHLLRPINEAINTCFNQMFDAGTLQNSGAGFIGDQLGVHSGSTNLQVGKFIRVNTKGASIRDSVFPIPFQGPSATLFQLLGVVISAGKEMAGIQQILTGDAAIANAPPTTVLALIEQGIQGYTAIIGRVFDGLQSEYDKLFRLDHKLLKDKAKAEYEIGDEWREVSADDFRLARGVSPAADPTMTTNMQRLGRAQMLIGLKDEQGMNRQEIIRRYLEAAGQERIDDLFSPPSPMTAIAMQMQMASAHAELGRKRAAEMKDQTQAYLNLAQAQKVAGENSAAWINQQLQLLQLHIESVNSQTKAAKVALEAHHHHAALAIESAHRDADRTADLVKHFNPQQSGGGGGDDEDGEPAGGQAPGNAGPYPVPVVPNAGGAMGGVAPQPGDAGVPALPG